MDIRGIRLDFLGHSGFLIRTPNKSIAIDPYNISLNIDKVNIILITHGHFDHCSIKDIQMLAKPGTLLIVPPDAQSKVMRVKDIELKTISLGKKIEIDENITIETFPAYNLNKINHQKNEEWLGYIIKINDIAIYHAGDTDKIPEMSSLSKYPITTFIALLPVSGEVVMTAEEAASVAEIIKPTWAIPMHYGAGVVGTIEDAKKFADLCKQKNINARILEKI